MPRLHGAMPPSEPEDFPTGREFSLVFLWARSDFAAECHGRPLAQFGERPSVKLSVIALDYDGTVARGDILDSSVREAIAVARTQGIVVLLVTGTDPL